MNSPSKYNSIGHTYNTTRMADPYLLSRMKFHLREAKNCLDVGSGTGNYTIALSESGIQMTGVEPSDVMIEKARLKSDEVEWIQGTAEEFKLNKQFESGLASLTLHHWGDIERGIANFQKHLQHGAPLVIFTSSPEQMETYWLKEYFPRMLKDSCDSMPSISEVVAALEKAGFTSIHQEKYFVKPDLKDQFLQCGKDQPELYFREDIRKGISSFQSFSYADEIESGLAKLRSDIDSGKWKEIRNLYNSDLGDYSFLIATNTSPSTQ